MALLLAFDVFELDEARFELRRDGEAVVVQPKVLELLLFLARHRDRVVHKDELFRAVWDGTKVSEASLSQAVRSARKVLGDSAREQRFLRTVRGRGLRFVVEDVRPVAPASVAPVTMDTQAGITAMETQDGAESEGSPEPTAFLVAVIHGDAPRAGGASWCLAGVDEVRVGRGSRRRSKREEGLTRTLRITVPEKRASREHVRFTRLPTGWMVVDEGSRNGTQVNGERVQKSELVSGDRVELGATTLLFVEAVGPREDVDTRKQGERMWRSLTPAFRPIGDDLERIATSNVPVLLGGESGTGKSHLALRLHEASRRTVCRTVDVPTLGGDVALLRRVAEEAEGGTLLLEGLDRGDEAIAPALARVLELAADVRVIATCACGFEELEQRLSRGVLSRVAGYRLALPPLRQRMADLGMLIAALLPEAPPMDAEVVRALSSHRWPGNLHELKLTLRAAAVVAEHGRIALRHLPAEFRDASDRSASL